MNELTISVPKRKLRDCVLKSYGTILEVVSTYKQLWSNMGATNNE